MKNKREIIILFIVGLIVVVFGPMLYCYYSNVRLREELRTEVDTWLSTLPEIPESENGAPVINKALAEFEWVSDDPLFYENTVVENATQMHKLDESQIGVRSMDGVGNIAEWVGTSFSTPLITATMASIDQLQVRPKASKTEIHPQAEVGRIEEETTGSSCSLVFPAEKEKYRNTCKYNTGNNQSKYNPV